MLDLGTTQAYKHIVCALLVCNFGVLYVLDCLEEIDAQEAKSLAIYKDGKHATLPFPDNKKFPHEPVGRLLRNGRLVQRLRQKAASLTKYVHKLYNFFYFVSKIKTISCITCSQDHSSSGNYCSFVAKHVYDGSLPIYNCFESNMCQSFNEL